MQQEARAPRRRFFLPSSFVVAGGGGGCGAVVAAAGLCLRLPTAVLVGAATATAALTECFRFMLERRNHLQATSTTAVLQQIHSLPEKTGAGMVHPCQCTVSAVRSG